MPVYHHRHKPGLISRSQATVWLILAAVLLLVLPSSGIQAASLSSASVTLSDPRPSATSSYTFTGSSVTTTLIRCVKTVFADTSGGTNVPAGMTTTSALLDTTTTNLVPTPASWSLNKATNGTLLLTNASGETPASAAARKLAYTTIANGTTVATSYWMRVTTFTNTDCATGPVDTSSVQFIYANGATVSLTVDQTLTFSVAAVAGGQTCNGATSTAASTATTIPFGNVNAATNAVVCQDLTAATNASNGYTITARYTAKPTNSLSQTINDVSGTNAAPAAFSAAGTEAYGYTTNDTTLGTGTPGRFAGGNWAAMATTGAEVGYESAGVSSTTYRIGHQVGVATTTRPGTYVTTVIYTCTPVY